MVGGLEKEGESEREKHSWPAQNIDPRARALPRISKIIQMEKNLEMLQSSPLRYRQGTNVPRATFKC